MNFQDIESCKKLSFYKIRKLPEYKKIPRGHNKSKIKNKKELCELIESQMQNKSKIPQRERRTPIPAGEAGAGGKCNAKLKTDPRRKCTYKAKPKYGNRCKKHAQTNNLSPVHARKEYKRKEDDGEELDMVWKLFKNAQRRNKNNLDSYRKMVLEQASVFHSDIWGVFYFVNKDTFVARGKRKKEIAWDEILTIFKKYFHIHFYDINFVKSVGYSNELATLVNKLQEYRNLFKIRTKKQRDLFDKMLSRYHFLSPDASHFKCAGKKIVYKESNNYVGNEVFKERYAPFLIQWHYHLGYDKEFKKFNDLKKNGQEYACKLLKSWEKKRKKILKAPSLKKPYVVGKKWNFKPKHFDPSKFENIDLGKIAKYNNNIIMNSKRLGEPHEIKFLNIVLTRKMKEKNVPIQALVHDELKIPEYKKKNILEVFDNIKDLKRLHKHIAEHQEIARYLM